MSRHATLKAQIGEELRKRGIAQLHYFHCDHFEPWLDEAGRDAVANAEAIDRFAETTSRIDYARRLTLFYKPLLGHKVDPYKQGERAAEDDPVVFEPKSPYLRSLCKQAMQHLLSIVGHELQVHVHHENFTHNGGQADARIARALDTGAARARESERFALGVRTALDAIESETGRRLHDRWFFIHGKWALNASDPDVCHIVDEISVLKQLGCLGDFSFPAGRPHTDPRYEAPYFMKPFPAVKAYDHEEAEPEFAWGAKAPKDKFFIWASKIKHTGSSLDYYSPWLRTKLEDIEPFLLEIVRDCFAIDGRLFFKTHCHSMHANYAADVRLPVYPHAYPQTQALLGTLFDACEEAGVEVVFSTASEIFDLFAGAERNSGTAPAMADLAPPALGAKPPPKLAHTPAAALVHTGAIEARAREVLSKRLAELGERESGAYAHYADQLKRGRMVTKASLEIAKYVLAEMPGARRCHEIGSGLGVLPILLAANGILAAGIENDPRRHRTAMAIFDACRDLTGAGACDLIEGRFPDVMAGAALDGVLAIFDDFTATTSEAEEARVIAGVRRYPAALIDADRFIRRRTTDAERRELIVMMMAQGFPEPRQAFDLGSAGLYLLFGSL